MLKYIFCNALDTLKDNATELFGQRDYDTCPESL